jgi:hypothetical protein
MISFVVNEIMMEIVLTKSVELLGMNGTTGISFCRNKTFLHAKAPETFFRVK